jgi:hypothetical protein
MFAIDWNWLIINVMFPIVSLILISIAIFFVFKRIFRIHIGKIETVTKKHIKRKDFDTKDEYIFNKKTDIVPSKRNRLICILFTESRGCFILFRKITEKNSYFTYRRGMYIIDNESIHITSNGCRIAFYLEGISTPIKMTNIQRETKDVEYLDLQGNKQKTTVQVIKGLKFDSHILDTFADEKFAENFTKEKIDNWQVFILIISIGVLIATIIGCAISYIYR